MQIVLYTKKQKLIEAVRAICTEEGYVLTQCHNPAGVFTEVSPRNIFIVDGRQLSNESYYQTCETLEQLSRPWIFFAKGNEQQLLTHELGTVFTNQPEKSKLAILLAQLARQFQPNEVTSQKLEYPGFSMNAGTYELIIDDEKIPTTAKEFKLLFVMASQPKRIFSRQELIAALEAKNSAASERSIDHHIKRLRKKMPDTQTCQIRTAYKRGYAFFM
ncbi:MAG: winged helix-turn-helix domain-containing protein [Culicoidibacterales bacterium]